jgi:hypothetical protein
VLSHTSKADATAPSALRGARTFSVPGKVLGIPSQLSEGSMRLPDIVDRVLRGLMPCFHDVGESSKLSILVLNLLLKRKVLHAETPIHLLHCSSRPYALLGGGAPLVRQRRFLELSVERFEQRTEPFGIGEKRLMTLHELLVVRLQLVQYLEETGLFVEHFPVPAE